jgi:hypothetical protein
MVGILDRYGVEIFSSDFVRIKWKEKNQLYLYLKK